MVCKRIGGTMANSLRTVGQKDFCFAKLFAILTVAFHTSGLVHRQIQYLHSELEILTSQEIFWLLTIIGLMLLIAALALWSRKLMGLIVSLVSLVAVGGGYLAWYLISRQDLSLQASKPFYKQHPEAMTQHLFGFVEAKWWDLVVLTMIVVLFLWEVKTLFIVLSLSRRDTLRKED